MLLMGSVEMDFGLGEGSYGTGDEMRSIRFPGEGVILLMLRIKRRELSAIGGNVLLKMEGNLRGLGLLMMMLEEDVRR